MHSSTQMGTSSSSPREGTSLPAMTGADALFDTLTDSLVAQLGAALPGLSAQELRTRLSAFRPRFDAIYQGVLQEHLGTDLERLVKELRTPKVRTYFEARRSMGPELGRLLQKLSFEMGETQV